MSTGYREGTGVGAQGIELFWRIWEPSLPTASLLLIHGLGEHSGRYRPFAEALAEEGTSVFAFDLRGHGQSPGPRGDVDAFPRLLEDLLGMEEEACRQLQHPGPRFLMGHSLGGLIGIRRLQMFKGPFSGAILSAPWLATAQPGWIRGVARFMGLALPTVPLPAGIHPRRLSRDPEMILRWRQDSLIHTRISGRFFREVDREQSKALVSGWPRPTPVLFLVPGADRVVKSPVTVAFSRTIVGEEVQVEILEGREHEPLNDFGREEVYRLVLDWLANQVDPNPDVK